MSTGVSVAGKRWVASLLSALTSARSDTTASSLVIQRVLQHKEHNSTHTSRQTTDHRPHPRTLVPEPLSLRTPPGPVFDVNRPITGTLRPSRTARYVHRIDPVLAAHALAQPRRPPLLPHLALSLSFWPSLLLSSSEPPSPWKPPHPPSPLPRPFSSFPTKQSATPSQITPTSFVPVPPSFCTLPKTSPRRLVPFDLSLCFPWANVFALRPSLLRRSDPPLAVDSPSTRNPTPCSLLPDTRASPSKRLRRFQTPRPDRPSVHLPTVRRVTPPLLDSPSSLRPPYSLPTERAFCACVPFLDSRGT